MPENRVYILNEGSYQKNNAGITYYDPDKRNNVIDDIFYKQNEAKLGDTGQDIIRYGSKIYIAVYKSSIVEVINANTGVTIKTIPMVTLTDKVTK